MESQARAVSLLLAPTLTEHSSANSWGEALRGIWERVKDAKQEDSTAAEDRGRDSPEPRAHRKSGLPTEASFHHSEAGKV